MSREIKRLKHLAKELHSAKLAANESHEYLKSLSWQIAQTLDFRTHERGPYVNEYSKVRDRLASVLYEMEHEAEDVEAPE